MMLRRRNQLKPAEERLKVDSKARLYRMGRCRENWPDSYCISNAESKSEEGHSIQERSQQRPELGVRQAHCVME